MKFTYVIVEDNPSALENLKIELQKFPNFINIGEASSYKEGKRLIVEKRPSLIFLDVELGDEKGYDLVKEIQPFFQKLPKIIMTTGHVKYAKESTNQDFLYFLDKPIDYDELYMALEKFKQGYHQENRTLNIRKKDGYHFFLLDEIYYFEGVNNKTNIVKTDLSENEVSKTLKDISVLLPEDFIRVHKSYIINTKFVEKMNLKERTIYLNIKSGIIEFQNPNQEFINLKSGKTFSFDESLQLKNYNIKIPIGDNYIPKIKDQLLIFNKF